MTAFLIDSDGLISYEHRVPKVMDRLDLLRLQGHDLGSCAITVAEFYSGRAWGLDAILDEFMDSLRYWDISYSDAIRAGNYRWQFARRGIQLSMTDTLIAAVAARVGATIITGNVKDFPMDGVTVESLLG